MTMNRRDFVALSLPAAGICRGQNASQVSIAVSPAAAPLEHLAAAELSKYLRLLYPENEFRVVQGAPPAGTFVQLGTPRSWPELRRYVPQGDLAQPDSFIVTNTLQGNAGGGIIVGADARATLYAVYALLERLGFGFYLSYDAHPKPRSGPFHTGDWGLADQPLAPERLVFNWHNFLSGCSGWNLPEWKLWISQAAKMRFSSILVHAYGNNPMAAFTHNGRRTPTGWVASTVRGRDWGTQHVNDVRRLVGGGELFQSPVFGADASLVPDEQTVEAVTDLMRQVFAFAKSRGLRVLFALDVDTESANPQNILETLPDAAVFSGGGFRLPRPDTPEGLAYFRSRIGQLLSNYPQIDQIVAWFRRPQGTSGRALMALRPDELPAAWKAEYEQAVQKHPALQKAHRVQSIFALGKIVSGIRRILDEMGRPGVQLALGSWRYDFLPAADAFLDRRVKCLCIDQFNVLAGAVQDVVREVGTRREVVSIPYAQDDDGGYVGRPYAPYANFASLLEQSKCAGFGILHWAMRPLDLYFKSLSTQVWKATRNESAAATCEQMAARSFGVSAREVGGRYLARWLSEAPMFGRETSDRFIDVPVRDPQGTVARAREVDRSYGPGGPLFLPPAEVIARAGQRLDLLSAIDASLLSKQESERLNYFRDFEQFAMGFYASQAAWEQSRELLAKGEIAQARAAVAQCRPEEVIRQYLRMAARGGMGRGEQALLISLNLRWLPYTVSTRQALGLDSIRLKFGPTQHEPLAQGAGSNTFYLDAGRRMWKVLGEKETGAGVFALGADSPEPEMCRSGLRIQAPLTLRLGPIAGDRMAPGRYTARLLVANPEGRTAGLASLELRGSAAGAAVEEVLDLQRHTGAKERPVVFSYPVEVSQGHVELSLRPKPGAVHLCGIILDPAG